MNVRKPADYSQLFAALDAVLTAEQAQTQRCYAIGRLIALRPEKGAAVAAASYLKARYPDIPGLSPQPAPDAGFFIAFTWIILHF